MAGTWRDAKCKLPRRSSPSTENESKDRATGEPDDAKVSSPVRRGADGKGRSRLPVTADAYGLTNPGIRRNLASRLPYENSLTLETFQRNPAGNQSRPVGGPIPKSGRSWYLWQPEKAGFSEKSYCITLYSGCESYHDLLDTACLFF